MNLRLVQHVIGEREVAVALGVHAPHHKLKLRPGTLQRAHQRTTKKKRGVKEGAKRIASLAIPQNRDANRIEGETHGSSVRRLGKQSGSRARGEGGWRERCADLQLSAP